MSDFATQRTTMVDCQIRPADVTDLSIIEAMAEIPREIFVDDAQKTIAYVDEDIRLEAATGEYSRYLMEPAPFARLLQLAQIGPDAIVLDIGCATGYSTAVLARLCSSVVALEQDTSLAELASENLARLEIDNAVVVTGPLNKGYPREGPFDIIMLNGAVSHVPPELKNQLKDGGRLLAVTGSGNSGTATLYIREGENVGEMSHFNCAVQPLPGFEQTVEFEF